jgi:hypothetical protein
MGEEKPSDKDRVMLLAPMAPDRSFPALRVGEDGKATVGVMSPVVEGQPLGERDVLSLKSIEGSALYEATVLYEGRPSSHAGPVMVNSREYRSGWDAVFGGAPDKRSAAN